MILAFFKRLWALPYTFLGAIVGLFGLITGGGVQSRRGVLEFHGGGTAWFLRCLPNGQYVLALTLGHTILGKNEAALEVARNHEHVHVQQFERWGPIMGPAYLGASVWIWLRGGRAYRDNPFEIEAYDKDGIKEN